MPPKNESYAQPPSSSDDQISKQRVREIIEKILLKSDFRNEGDIEIVHKKLNEFVMREDINPDEDEGRKKIESLALDILSERESIKENQPDESVAIEKDSVVGVGKTPTAALRDALENKNKGM